jgi:hypothetical protein
MGLDANAGRYEFGRRLLGRRYPFDLDVLVGTTQKLVERADVFNTDPWQRIGNKAANSAACPGETVFFEQHQRFPDHGAADVHHGAEFSLCGEQGTWRQDLGADCLGDAGVGRDAQGLPGLGRDGS